MTANALTPMSAADAAAHEAASHVRQPAYRLPSWYDEQHAREHAVEFLSRAEVEATIAHYIEIHEASEPLRHIPGIEMSDVQWRKLWAADDQLHELYDRLNRAVALVYLPAGLRPAYLDHLAEADAAEARGRGW